MLFFADLRCQVDEGTQNMLVIQFTTFHVEVAMAIAKAGGVIHIHHNVRKGEISDHLKSGAFGYKTSFCRISYGKTVKNREVHNEYKKLSTFRCLCG